jgi:predicted Zn-dependent peptidase
MNAFKALAKKHFGAWKNSDAANTTAPIPTAVAPNKNATIFFIDLPGGAQATIAGATIFPPSQQLDMRALNLANAAFGGLFTSRLNMNLREDKHWSYGTRSSIVESRGPQMWIATGGIQIDKTGPALSLSPVNRWPLPNWIKCANNACDNCPALTKPMLP